MVVSYSSSRGDPQPLSRGHAMHEALGIWDR